MQVHFHNAKIFFIIEIQKYVTMYSFIICLLALIASYFVYGKIVERTVGVDETKETPAIDCMTVLTIYPCLESGLF